MKLSSLVLKNFHKGSMKIDYGDTKKFSKEFAKLKRKYPTLAEDLEINKQYRIELFHLKSINNGSIFKITGIPQSKTLEFFIVKKFQCRSLKGSGSSSGIRLTYGYFPADNKIVFIEIYFKGDKENEDKQRIVDFVDSLS